MSKVRWFAPSPLWADLVGKPASFRAPALLRFAGDDFVPQFQGALETDPRSLRAFVARPETWREPAVGLDTAPSTKHPLRLYQPVHGRFYLVAASLACRVPGLPEHTLDAARGDLAAFVVRRITVSVSSITKQETETGEWAWVKRADGSEGWVSAAGQALVPGEEQHPMFAAGYAARGGLRGSPVRRRVLAGLIPASRREAYVNARELAAQAPVPASGSLDDPRVLEFQRAVLDPWTELKEWYDLQKPDDVRRALALESAEQSAWPVLLDFRDFLEAHLKPVWEAVVGARAPGTLTGAQKTLYDRLAAVGLYDRNAGQRASIPAAMQNAHSRRALLEQMAVPLAGFPAGYVARVLIGDPRPPAPAPDPAADEGRLWELLDRAAAPLEAPGLGVRVLKKLVMDALAQAAVPAPKVEAGQLPQRAPANAQGDDWYVVRCVYLQPYCGKNPPPVVSDRSERFRLSSFFEPDAPARQLRVALPVDTSPGTLRKYNRNVAFLFSDQLRQQMSRVTDMKKLLDGETDEPDAGLTLSVICSFSIPIITICALILLMIIVSLLNIVFWWLPLFRICFPVPSLKAKG